MPQIQIGAIWCTQINCGYTPPVDPRFRGCQITTMDQNTGFVYDERRIPGESGGPEVRGVGAIFPTPSMVKEVDVWFQSYSDLGVNPIVHGVTPRNTVTVGRTGGVLDLAMATPGTLQTAAFASTIKPVEIVATLPVSFTDYPQGAVVFLTSDNKLYRSTGTAWTKVLDATDIPDRTIAGTKMIALSITSNELAADSATFGKVAAAAVGTRELVTGELLVGLGGGKPTKFKVVDSFGSATAFLGADASGNWNWFNLIRVGNDINNPNFYADGSGVWMQNVPVSFSNTTLTTTINSAYNAAVGAWAAFETHATPTSGHPTWGAWPTYIVPGGVACVVSTLNTNPLWALSTTGLFFYDGSNNQEVWIDPANKRLYFAGVQVLGQRNTGWSMPTGATSKASFDPSTVTLQTLAQFVSAMVQAAAGSGWLGA
jgi:hypothetical protein